MTSFQKNQKHPRRVIPLSSVQNQPAAKMLTRAFYDDPAFTYMFPDPASRTSKATWFFEKTLLYGSKFGEVYTTSDTEGAAIWLPPGSTDVTTLRMIRVGLLLAPVQMGWSALTRFLNIAEHTEKGHKQLVPGRHWYLQLLGVEPDLQGQGIGAALIEPVLAKADQQSLPCYLETMKERNLAFYQKQGFEVVLESTVPKGGPKVWAMLRKAGN